VGSRLRAAGAGVNRRGPIAAISGVLDAPAVVDSGEAGLARENPAVTGLTATFSKRPLRTPRQALSCPACARTFTQGQVLCPFDRTPLSTPPVAADVLLGTIVNGTYTILERVGAGGMGVVYRALQHRLDRHVALKVLPSRFGADPAAVDRFRLEARAASQLTNGHTVTIHDFGAMDDGSLYIAMQLLEGESLKSRLQAAPLSLREAITIAMHICESLAEAHDHAPSPIIHRDIKPDNVFVHYSPRGEVHATVLDFGIARFADPQGARLTSENVALGTPVYMSPEQCRGLLTVDARSDLYSLGILLFEMVVGRPPFLSEDPHAVLYMHVRDAAPRMSSLATDLTIPGDLETLVARLLAKAPEDRPDSAEATRAELARIQERLSEASATAPHTGGAPAVTLEPRRAQEGAPERGTRTPTTGDEDPWAGVASDMAPPGSRNPRPGRAGLLLAAALIAVAALVLAGFRRVPASGVPLSEPTPLSR